MANKQTNGKALTTRGVSVSQKNPAGLVQLLIAVGGIYASFLTWALLQERLTTTSYGSAASPEFFKFPIFLNTIQSSFAVLTGLLYLTVTTSTGKPIPPLFPSKAAFVPLLLVSITASLASPFGYASLAHIDYITFILAKSCKLLPVMFLHITIYRKRYPLYKYLVVLAVTAGVAVFTLHASSHKNSKSSAKKNSSWGLLLLGINLLFDGLTNSTQDYIFSTFQPYTGPQMMCATNLLNTLLTMGYLGLSPYVAHTGVGEWIALDLSAGGQGGEVGAALAFMRRHPGVWTDVLGFAACGAVGQVFIFYTLSAFSSLLLVTVTVTRKMLTMILSVVWFGHRLSGMQWLGVGLVFGAVGAEGVMTRREKLAKSKKTEKSIKKEL